MRRATPIQLGWSQLAIVFAGLATVLAVVWVTLAWNWEEFYYREFATPRLQAKYGFRYGHLRAVRGGTTYLEGPGIVSVDLHGEFARLGIRPGDIPFEYHGGGFTAMYYALEGAERSSFAAFDVVNAYDFSAGAEGFRTIPVYPRVREVPVDLLYHGQLRSPAGPLTAIVAQSPVDDTDREIWLWDPVAGNRQKLHRFRRFVKATWSADSNWLAVTDQELIQPSRCVVIDVQRGQTQDLTDALMTLPRSTRPASSDRVECEIFGWVLDDPARLAVIFSDLGAAHGHQWIYSLLFDTRTTSLTPAHPR